MKSHLIAEDPDGGKDGRLKEKGMTGVEMVGWHHQLSEQEFEQTQGYGEGQGTLARCSPCRCKESGTTSLLNNNKMC